jgi:hypothetical protein
MSSLTDNDKQRLFEGQFSSVSNCTNKIHGCSEDTRSCIHIGNIKLTP